MTPLNTTATFQRILFVDLKGASDGLPDNILDLREWTWRRTPFVRWSYAKGTDDIEILKERFGKADLGVLLWPADSGGADPIPQWIRKNDFRPLPLLVVWPGSDHKEVIDASMTGWKTWRLLPASETQDPSKVAAAFEALGVQFRDYDLELVPDQNDLFVTGMIESFGRKRQKHLSGAQPDVLQLGRQYLEHIIQRFFPDDKTVKIHAVGGGWSGDSLCRVYVGPELHEHFIKFYSDKEPNDKEKSGKKKYEAEFKNHLKAQDSLGEHIVTLKRVPGLGGGDGPEAEAFPAETQPPVWAICFESAAKGYPGCETFKRLYAIWADGSVDQAINQLLTAVPAPFDPTKQEKRAPWGTDKGSRFRLTSDLKRSVLYTISDLDSYGPAVCGKDWPTVCSTVKDLVYRPLSELPWLEVPWPVAMGYIHGDPNSRNCFFDENDPTRLKLIDCGDFTEQGRLVSDLAMIERELKIVLMGTDPMAKGYLDLDPRRLSGAPHPLAWCAAEQASIAKGLAYTEKDAELALAADPSIRRAYRAIARVRARAKAVSGDFDPWGRHYFAALLYWTLDILKEPAVRRTKKLLAIYSAAQILRKDFP
jgi:hypothetical protein